LNNPDSLAISMIGPITVLIYLSKFLFTCLFAYLSKSAQLQF